VYPAQFEPCGASIALPCIPRSYLSGYRRRSSLPERWLSEHRQAASLDPLSALDLENIGEALHALGRNDEAIAELNKALALDPNLVFTLSQLCVVYAEGGTLEDARKILDGRLTALDTGGNYAMLCQAAINRAEPGSNSTLHNLAQAAARGYLSGKVSASTVGLIQAYAGDIGSAVVWFWKSVAGRESKFFQSTIGNLLPAAVRRDSRWKAIRSGSNFEEWRRIRAAMANASGG
jgi:tetratricopeptide (TPR) repeat protein